MNEVSNIYVSGIERSFYIFHLLLCAIAYVFIVLLF